MFISLKEKSSKINSSEKKVLIEMLANPGKTFSRDEISKISGINQKVLGKGRNFLVEPGNSW